MINPLLIVRKEYAHTLQRYCKKKGLTPRCLIGNNWKLSDIVRSLISFEVQTHFLIDISAVNETDEELVKLLGAIKLQREDVVLIIYAPDKSVGDKELDKLVRAGYTNIITCEGENDDSKTEYVLKLFDSCLFGEPIAKELWEKFLIVEKPPEVKEKSRKTKKTNIPVEREAALEKLSYRNLYCDFAFVGAQKHIGNTSFALMCAVYFSQSDATVLFICETDEDYAMLRKQYAKNPTSSESFMVMGVNFCPPSVGEKLCEETYNVIVRDFGTDATAAAQANGDLWLTAGIFYNEIFHTWDAMDLLIERKYNIAVPFASRITCEKAKEDLFRKDEEEKELFTIPFVEDKLEPNPYTICAFNKLFKEYSDTH